MRALILLRSCRFSFDDIFLYSSGVGRQSSGSTDVVDIMFDGCLLSFFSAPAERFTIPPSRTLPLRFALPFPPTFMVGRTCSSRIVWRSSSRVTSSSSSPSSSSSKSLAAFDAAGVCISWGSMLGESADAAENEPMPEPDDPGLLIWVSWDAYDERKS